MTTAILIGTTKGLFILSTEDRESWATSGPHCDLWPINHAV
ncbi:MAG: exo-alpha-sialidase, partial [Silicimonas sp.]|nr:exo-alpha-sialidase [Silicimonas sp.]